MSEDPGKMKNLSLAPVAAPIVALLIPAAAPIVALLIPVAAAASVVEIPIEGKVAATKTEKLAKLVSKSDGGFALPAPGSAEDPSIGGAELQFFDTSAPGAGHVTLTLDASGWKALGNPAGSKGYKYKGRDDVLDADPKGTCRSVVVKTNVIKAVCKGTAIALQTPFAGREGISLGFPASGPSTTYCAEFGGIEKKNDEKVMVRKDAPAPSACPLPEADLAGFDPGDVAFLADDALQGRNNGTDGSATAQGWLIDELQEMGAIGANSAATGDAAFKQAFNLGTNVVGILPGTDLANEYVVVGGHYDHLGSCTSKELGDTVCNGATDNATGTSAVLTIGRALGHVAHRRSVVLALWDREEDGLLGSAYYAANPLVPLADTVAYVNFDIQGANLLPSVRNVSFAIAAETGGADLKAIVDAAIGNHTLGTRRFSYIFGQGRSDYVNFVNKSIPSVFFSDATGPCYHTNQDETAVVDFGKLEQQARIALDVVVDLANVTTPPAFVAPFAGLATFEDAVVLNEVLNAGIADLALFGPVEQATLLAAQGDVSAIVADGAALFDSGDVVTVLLAALDVLSALETLDCDGFLLP